MTYKPEGYSSVSPYLIVSDAHAMLDFLEAAFGATRLRVIPREGGTGIMHAEARIDDTVVMMGEAPGGPNAHVHVYVADPQAVFDRALKAGASEVQPLKDQGDGDMRGGVQDPQGTTWWIAKQVC